MTAWYEDADEWEYFTFYGKLHKMKLNRMQQDYAWSERFAEYG